MKLGSPIPRRHSRIEIIPLIDIMFFLLASFMMVSLNMSKLNVIKVEAPAARSGDKDLKADVFNVTLKRDGALFVGESPATLPQLGLVLSNRFQGAGTNVPIYVSGDKDTPHGAVIAVLDVIRRAGIQRVSFAVAPAAP